jgi:Uma2 family endonuclease
MATATATTTTALDNLAGAGLKLYRLSVIEYDRMAESGLLADPRVELIDGLLVRKMTKKPEHSATIGTVQELLGELLQAGSGWHLRVEQPVRIPEYDEPEPDLAVARGKSADYRGHHPGPGDVALVIEVAGSSLTADRIDMARAYGIGGIPIYWIVNLIDRQVEVYQEPDPIRGGYSQRAVYQLGDSVPVVIAGAELGVIAVADLLA